jgi:MscS family membrane protein
VGVTYSTTPEQMEELLRRIRELLKNDEGVDPDFFIVRFTDFGASSLDIFLYYFTKSIKWDEHLGVRERVNLNVMRSIREMGLSIAFPTRSIHLESLPPALSLGSRPE